MQKIVQIVKQIGYIQNTWFSLNRDQQEHLEAHT